MSLSNQERFHELADKVLAKEAQPAEEAELRALIAENPQLKEEFERMGSERAAAREILPLLEDVRDPSGNAPPVPMERLRKEVRDVFDRPAESQGELRELLSRLEKWAGRQLGAERELIMNLISVLRESPWAPRSSPSAVMLESQAMVPPRQRLQLREEPRAFEEAEETKGRDAEFENRLRSLEERIRRAEQITHECSEEVRAMLEAFARERKIRAERSVRNPNPSTKPQD